jgi:hypothetical protein
MSSLTTMRDDADSAKAGKNDATIQKAAPNAMEGYLRIFSDFSEHELF